MDIDDSDFMIYKVLTTFNSIDLPSPDKDEEFTRFTQEANLEHAHYSIEKVDKHKKQSLL